MICKFEVRGGKSGSVFFTSKFLQTECFKKAEIAQKSIVPEYCTRSAGSDSSKSVLGKVVSSVPNFIGRPNSTAQDDGIIVFVVINYIETKGERDFVVWLEGRDLTEFRRTYFDTEIPIALHSIWHSN
ncbi:Retinoid isomerohydrolase [Folsomia candida]|uniref:Retinoid isomerohydrolase n=1 Tax=Folsomia candida TaxID=158441 RepID=A0A226EKN2_FOLCA|nr:Retinoid isomerohydrolase [Folsomia candida]